jgi:hypothetical protein
MYNTSPAAMSSASGMVVMIIPRSVRSSRTASLSTFSSNHSPRDRSSQASISVSVRPAIVFSKAPKD